MDTNNPIRSVDGVAVCCPSSYQWKIEDVSSPDAGRTEDIEMHKMRIGQAVGIELGWRNVSIEEAAAILQAFNPEYVEVVYLDAMIGLFVKKLFYVGNRSAPLYNSKLKLWSNISFNLVERKPKTYNASTRTWNDDIPATGGA